MRRGPNVRRSSLVRTEPYSFTHLIGAEKNAFSVAISGFFHLGEESFPNACVCSNDPLPGVLGRLDGHSGQQVGRQEGVLAPPRSA
jgi:hypothetical protein